MNVAIGQSVAKGRSLALCVFGVVAGFLFSKWSLKKATGQGA